MPHYAFDGQVIIYDWFTIEAMDEESAWAEAEKRMAKDHPGYGDMHFDVECTDCDDEE